VVGGRRGRGGQHVGAALGGVRVAPPPEDAGLLRQRYEALQERRQRIGEALPERLRPDAASPRPALRGAGVVEPPRMDSGDENPDGVRFLPAVDGAAGGGQ